MAKKNKNKNEPVTFELLTEFYVEFIKPQFDKLNEKMDKQFRVLKEAIRKNTEAIKKNSDDIQVLKVETSYVKDEIKGLKADLSDTPTRKEFNQLKTTVKSLQV